MNKLIDLTGKKFGRLLVLGRDKNKTRTSWICKCDCGNIKSISGEHLKSGATTSCGCLQKERASQANKKHGNTHTSLHNRWKALKQRCTNPNNQAYERYGGRGIELCSEWNDFQLFEKWALENGYKENLQLDRIDNNKGYEPNNCRWCTSKENNRNRRITAMIDGIPLAEFAEINGISYETVHYCFYRLKKQNKNINKTTILAYANQLPLRTRKRRKV